MDSHQTHMKPKVEIQSKGKPYDQKDGGKGKRHPRPSHRYKREVHSTHHHHTLTATTLVPPSAQGEGRISTTKGRRRNQRRTQRKVWKTLLRTAYPPKDNNPKQTTPGHKHKIQHTEFPCTNTSDEVLHWGWIQTETTRRHDYRRRRHQCCKHRKNLRGHLRRK